MQNVDPLQSLKLFIYNKGSFAKLEGYCHKRHSRTNRKNSLVLY